MTSDEPPPPTSLSSALTRDVVILDGGLATELERRGFDVSSDLWSAALLRDAPAAVRDTHAAYFRAGARVATTASYQASFEGFAAAGLDAAEAERLMRRSVGLAAQARHDEGLDGRAWVAASVGPYGAVLAEGQEYTGDYPAPRDTVAGLRDFHRARLELLLEAGADVLACETIPRLAEVEALVTELDTLGATAWISLTTVIDTQGRVRTRRDEDAGEAFALAGAAPSVVAVGVNCTAPAGVEAAVRLAAERSGKPVIAYPNSGETWDGANRRWVGAPGLDGGDVADWISGGARLVGGCCRIGPEDIEALAGAVGRLR
ncbi:MAG: homocysteine S-methyltransferase [Kineosporiaceae bacterium]|nr:homocysteine S-methyltransferase [Kineosporiaceae bacterium]